LLSLLSKLPLADRCALTAPLVGLARVLLHLPGSTSLFWGNS
jgi:hypothetical protein